MDKVFTFDTIENHIKSLGFIVISKDFNKPWGGFLVIDEIQSKKFINYFFDGYDIESLKIAGKLSPKILIVNPNVRLSWQYHHRRAEIWKVFDGRVGVIRSDNNNENQMEVFSKDNIIKLKKGERHRLVGLKKIGIVAEIWQHTDLNNPSNENDIIRLQDDFGREK